MSQRLVTRLCQPITRVRSQGLLPTHRILRAAQPAATHIHHPTAAAGGRRGFVTTLTHSKGIMPETENPQKADPAPVKTTWAVMDVSEGEYHEIADAYMDNMLAKFEELQEKRTDLDVEYASGVMTITTTDKGTYVLNKQPPNKQIWLSSPSSGPKRYDWCVLGEGQHDKEGTAEGSWIYARDGSSLDQLILEELDVDISRASVEV